MRGSLLILAGAALLLSPGDALAGPYDYLFRNERICDVEEVFCLRGTLSYHSNPRILHLRARVQKAPGPGLLRIRVAGANELGHRRLSPLEIRVRGRYSEIINQRIIPDHPDVDGWEVESVEFIVEKAL